MTPKAGGSRVARSVLVQASPERALGAFLRVEDLRQWWGAARGLVEASKGGPWTLVWEEPGKGIQYAVSGSIKSLTPGRRVRIDPLVYLHAERGLLGPMSLHVSVRAAPDGRTRVRVRQDGCRPGPEWDWYFEACAAGWKTALGNLKRFLESAGR